MVAGEPSSLAIASETVPVPNGGRGARGYLEGMLRQFDPSGAGSIKLAKEYLESLAIVSDRGIKGLEAKTDYGPYTLAKHLFLYEYLRPFFAIGSLKFRRLVYVDMFAGPGLNVIDRGGSLFVTPGSPLISYLYTYTTKGKQRRERFDSYYFFETNGRKAEALQQRLDTIRKDFRLEERANVLLSDSQESVWKVMESEADNLKDPKKTEHRKDSGLLFLLFIDPEGLGLKFDSLIRLLKRYVATVEEDKSSHYFTADVIYTAPTHWGKQSGNDENLRLYCGVEPNRQYTDEQVARLMADRITKEIGGNCFVHSIPVRNAKNAIQYHIFSVTKSIGASKAAASLTKPLGLRAKDLQSALDALFGGASSIDDYWSQ